MAPAQPTTNGLLGYPDSARLLIVNADDFGMSHAGNEATIRSLLDGVATSTTVMPPCPWAPHALQLLQKHPEIPFGVHLTLTCDFDIYRWGPLCSRNEVPSLVDETGYFRSNARIPELLGVAVVDEVEREFRAQIESVLTVNLAPTHLDWHCLANGGSPDIFQLTLALAREYGLALRVHDTAKAMPTIRRELPVVDRGVLDSYRLSPDEKPVRYIQLLRELPFGLSEWAVHPSLGNDEARALEPDTWRIRRSDFDFLTSPEARDAIEQEGIVLLDYRPLQAQWSTDARTEQTTEPGERSW